MLQQKVSCVSKLFVCENMLVTIFQMNLSRVSEVIGLPFASLGVLTLRPQCGRRCIFGLPSIPSLSHSAAAPGSGDLRVAAQHLRARSTRGLHIILGRRPFSCQTNPSTATSITRHPSSVLGTRWWTSNLDARASTAFAWMANGDCKWNTFQGNFRECASHLVGY